MLPYNNSLKKYSKELRKNMTDAEGAVVKDTGQTTERLSIL